MQLTGQGKESLRLNREDSRPKVLFLSAIEDNKKEALNPENNSELLDRINKNFDLKYRVVSSPRDVCDEIEDGVKLTNLPYVIIQGHGSQDGICLDCKSGQWIAEDTHSLAFRSYRLQQKCSCLAVKQGRPIQSRDVPIISLNRSRTPLEVTVIASTESSYGVYRKIVSIDPLMISHRSHNDVAENIYKVFHPQYKKCTNLSWHQLHDKEKRAIDAVNDGLRAASTYSPDFQQTQDYFRHCKKIRKIRFCSCLRNMMATEHLIQNGMRIS